MGKNITCTPIHVIGTQYSNFSHLAFTVLTSHKCIHICPCIISTIVSQTCHLWFPHFPFSWKAQIDYIMASNYRRQLRADFICIHLCLINISMLPGCPRKYTNTCIGFSPRSSNPRCRFNPLAEGISSFPEARNC